MKTIETKSMERETDYGYGNKYISIYRIMCELTRNMKDRDCTPEQVAIFQNDFMKSNEFFMPETFFPEHTMFDEFLELRTKKDEKSIIKAKELYECYCDYCNENTSQARTKGEFFAELRARGMLSITGTMNGITVRNVVKGVTILAE